MNTTSATVRCLTCGRTGNAGSYPMIDHDFAGFHGPHMDYEAVPSQPRDRNGYTFRFRRVGSKGHFGNLCQDRSHVSVTGLAAAEAKLSELRAAHPNYEFKINLALVVSDQEVEG